MIEAKYDWKENLAAPDDDFLTLSKKMNLSNLTGKILWQRGIRQKKDVENFLKPSLENLLDPLLLHDMGKAVERIRQAVAEGQKILVYGDYDADGMTAASVMKTALDELGADETSQVYLPNRFTDGYGPNLEVYRYYIEKEKVQLIITVDNGVSGHEAITYAQEAGVDVIVTDHHSLPETLPKAYAIIHPEHPDSDYPFKFLAGVGVAFKVACALLESVPQEMLDLVAIGTVADMVSLTGENRILVSYGIRQLRATDRQGLLELYKISGIDSEQITEETIGFQLAPRLNALGRLDDPNPAIALLIGWDEEESKRLASFIEEKNTERKAIVELITQEALTRVTEEPVQILYKKGWHRGVLGIVAGKILEKTGKPVILLSEEEGVLKGSARSTNDFNMFEALTHVRVLFEAVGGHKQAAGMTILLEKFEEMKKAVLTYAESHSLLNKLPEQNIAAKLKVKEIDIELLDDLGRLAPFGMANEKPRFEIKNYQILSAKSIGQDNTHLKLHLKQEETEIDGIYFGQGAEVEYFSQLGPALLATLATNTWNGKTSVQLQILDARVEDVALLDARNKRLKIPETAMFYPQNRSKNDTMGSVLVVQETPETTEDWDELRELITQKKHTAIYFRNEISKPYYLEGAASREEFTKLYKVLSSFPEFDVRHKLLAFAEYVKIPESLLTKMLQIFEELGFVKIADGILTLNKKASFQKIEDSKRYQALKLQMSLQKFFALAPVNQIYQDLRENKKPWN